MYCLKTTSKKILELMSNEYGAPDGMIFSLLSTSDVLGLIKLILDNTEEKDVSFEVFTIENEVNENGKL